MLKQGRTYSYIVGFRTLVRFHRYTTDIPPWQLPNIYMDSCYFIGKLRNFEESYAFTNTTFDIANFLGFTQLLHLDGVDLLCNFLYDLYISLAVFCHIMRRYMHRTEYFVKYQDEYDYPVSVLLHYYQLFSKNISRIIARICVVFLASAKSWSFSAKIIYFFDVLLCTLCMRWYNIVKF